AFLGLGVLTTGALALVGEGDWALGATLFIFGNIGVTSSIVFYESLLPNVCNENACSRVSSAGYACGYVGGGLAMLIAVLAIGRPHWFGLPNAQAATRMSFVLGGGWGAGVL